MDEIKCIRKNGLLYVSALVYLEFLLLVGLCFFLKIFPRVTQLTTYYFISLVGSSSRVFGIQLLHMEFMRTAFFSVARQIQLGHSRQTPTFGFPPKKDVVIFSCLGIINLTILSRFHCTAVGSGVTSLYYNILPFHVLSVFSHSYPAPSAGGLWGQAYPVLVLVLLHVLNWGLH